MRLNTSQLNYRFVNVVIIMRYLDNMNLNVFLLHVRDSFGYGITKQFDFGKAVDVGT